MRQQLFYRLATVLLLALSFNLARAQAVRINEILANNTRIVNTDGTITDLVELYNTTGGDMDISGWSMSDSNAFPQRYIFPFPTLIAAGSFKTLIFDSAHSNAPPGTAVPFGIKASGGYLFLYDQFVNLVDAVEYGLQVQDMSLVRLDISNWGIGIPSMDAPNSSLQLGPQSALKVNEWLADQSGSGPDDYFEIYNPTNKPILLGGLYLTDTSLNSIQYLVAPLSFIGTGAQAYVKFVADGGGTNRYPADHVNFKLSPNGGDSIIIYLANGFTEVHNIHIDAGQVANVSEGFLPDGNTANKVRFPKINDYETRSPGEPNFLLFTNLYVNEILTHTDPPLEDAVEFQNRFATNLNISGWWLSNSRINRKRYQIPAGAALTPGGFRVIYEGLNSSVGFNSTTAADPFTFNSAHGDNVVLSQVDANGNLTGYIAYEEFEAAANGVSFGHYRTSVTNKNDYKFVAMSTTTFGDNDAAVTSVNEFRQGTGRTNSYPKVGPIVINEIMFQPVNTLYTNSSGTPVFSDSPYEEYIELRNITPNAVPLYDPAYPTNHWKLRKAVDFVFPLTNLSANSFCLVVGFDPYTNASALANFRAHYSFSNDVPIFGPWSGQLNNGGDAIELYRPDPVQLPPHPDAGFVPYIRIDKVNYLSNTNWPNGAGGSGNTLQRKISLAFGNDPTNWTALPPNAGRSTPAAFLDTDGDGMPDGWEMDNGFNKNSSADASQDADGDGFTNLAEYLAGTDPRNASVFLKIMEITPFVSSNVPVYIRFLAYSNASYTVEFRSSLTNAPNWQKLGDVPSAPSNRVVEVPDPNAYKKVDRYYRVVAPLTN